MGFYTFGKEERIRRRVEFQRISQEGVKYQTKHFWVYVCPNRLPYRRLGITAGKRIGSAVERNHLKRLLREFFRRHKELLFKSSDFVVTAKAGATKLDFWQVTEELKGILQER